MNKIPLKSRLLAHRGNSDHYPENSLQSFQSALSAGARFVETDVQISKDHVAVLSHDASLKKITGRDIVVSESYFEDIKELPAAYKTKFSNRYKDYKLATLEQLCELLADYPNTQCFIEIKEDCIKAQGHKVLDIVLSAVKPILSQVNLISFNLPLLQQAKQASNLPIGWVWPENNASKNEALDEKYVAMCVDLAPDYVFCNKDLLPLKTSAFWQGDWVKVVYTITKVEEIKTYENMGFSLFETNNITQHIIEVSNQ